MPARVIRDSVLESDRWLSLAHPVERLAYVVLLLKVDDLATCDASDGQLVRMWRDACNVKGRDDALLILQALNDADLVRVYESEGKRYIFVPRFRQRFRANSLRRPLPPENLLHDEPEVLQNIRQIKAKTSGMSDNGRTAAGQASDTCQSLAPVGEGEADLNTCASDGKPSSPKQVTKIRFEGGAFIGIAGDQVQRWAEAYPAIDVRSEVKRAAIWLEANPKNRKSNYQRFLTNWFSRTQDRAGRVTPTPGNENVMMRGVV